MGLSLNTNESEFINLVNYMYVVSLASASGPGLVRDELDETEA